MSRGVLYKVPYFPIRAGGVISRPLGKREKREDKDILRRRKGAKRGSKIEVMVGNRKQKKDYSIVNISEAFQIGHGKAFMFDGT